jgi:hypothetical protein
MNEVLDWNFYDDGYYSVSCYGLLVYLLFT